MAFCRQCGSPVGEVKFCSKCGAAVLAAPATVPVSSAPSSLSQPPASPVVLPAYGAPQTAPAQGSSVLVKVLVGFLVFVLLVVMAVMGSCVYIGYRAKKKADEIQQAYKSNDLSKLAGALGVGSSKHGGGSPDGSSSDSSTDSGSGSSVSAPLSFPAWNPSTTGNESGSKVPLRPGLTVVTAIAQFGGDYESIKQIQKVGASEVGLSYRADNVPNPLEGLQKLSGDKAPKASGSVTGSRTVRVEDLQTAHDYMQWFGPNQPEVMPGSTAISVSREVLAELKGKGETQFSFRIGGLKGMAGSLLGALGQMAGGGAAGAPKETKNLANMGKGQCMLKRVGSGLTSFPVLLNNQRVSLPAVHAQCTTDDGLDDFYFLDDLDNPLALAWKLAGSDTLQLVKISYPAQSPQLATPGVPHAAVAGTTGGAGGGGGGGGGGGQQIEQDLKQKGQAEVYGIYFDFASDKIKPESEPVLREIADALTHNPTWKLRVEGHTDNIGGDDYNMDLSQRRAEAVKLALVTRYHIVADRLTPQGFGATRPKEPNDTLAGRARNRRVELVRE
jgi:outer membrane protein OmpA-like peptidoglycan-associated protein